MKELRKLLLVWEQRAYDIRSRLETIISDEAAREAFSLAEQYDACIDEVRVLLDKEQKMDEYVLAPRLSTTEIEAAALKYMDDHEDYVWSPSCLWDVMIDAALNPEKK